MKRNIGLMDKGIRFFIAAFCGYYAVTLEPRTGINGFLFLTAFYLFVSAMSGTCFFYQIFRFSTHSEKPGDSTDKNSRS